MKFPPKFSAFFQLTNLAESLIRVVDFFWLDCVCFATWLFRLVSDKGGKWGKSFFSGLRKVLPGCLLFRYGSISDSSGRDRQDVFRSSFYCFVFVHNRTVSDSIEVSKTQYVVVPWLTSALTCEPKWLKCELEGKKWGWIRNQHPKKKKSSKKVNLQHWFKKIVNILGKRLHFNSLILKVHQ